MAVLSCLLLDGITNFLNQALLRYLAVADTVLVAGNGQQALALLHTRSYLPGFDSARHESIDKSG